MIFRVSWSWCPPSSHKSTSIRASLHRDWPHHGRDCTRSRYASYEHGSPDSTSSWCTTGCPRGLVPTHFQPSESHRVGMDPPAFCIARLSAMYPASLADSDTLGWLCFPDLWECPSAWTRSLKSTFNPRDHRTSPHQSIIESLPCILDEIAVRAT